MGDEPEIDRVETLDPDEAFALFGHELRLEILFALWKAPDYSLGFTDLRNAVGVRDKGQFNYHLSKLVDRFVAHVGDKYELTYAGHRVIDALQMGVFTEDVALDPVELDEGSVCCGAAVRFAYADHIGTVTCSDCGGKVLEYPYDPAGLAGRTREEIVRDFDRRTRFVWSLALDGVCPICCGPVDRAVTDEVTTALEAVDRYEEFFADDHAAVAAVSCDRCSYYSYLPVGARLLSHPGVVGFLFDRGVDVRSERTWRLPFVVDAAALEVQSRDPWTVDVTVAAGTDQRVATVDDDLAVDFRP